METQSALPIQYSNDTKSGISRSSEQKQNSSASSYTSFLSSLKESVIDVYERSDINIAVPDERTGSDRRISPTRRRSSPESAFLQTDNKVKDVGIYPTEQKISQIYSNAEKITPSSFSQSQDKGILLDIWV